MVMIIQQKTAPVLEIPIHAIGVGEKQEDLNVFEAEPYARALLGLEIDDY